MKRVINFVLAVSLFLFVSACGGSRQEVQNTVETADSAVAVVDSAATAVSDSITTTVDSVMAVVDSVKTEE